MIAEERLQKIHNSEQLRFVLGLVLRHQVEHHAHAPLVEVLQAVQQVVDQRLRLREIARDFLQSQQGVRHHQRVSVQHQVLKSRHQVAVTHTLLLDVVELQHAHDGVAANVGALVHQSTLQARNHVLHDRLQTEGAQRTKSHSTNSRILIATRVKTGSQRLPILLEGVNSENSQLLILLSIGHQELVRHLLHYDILGNRHLAITHPQNCVP